MPTLEDYPKLTDIIAPDHKPAGYKWREYQNETDDGGVLSHAYPNSLKPRLNRANGNPTYQQHYFQHWATDISLVDTTNNYAGIADLLAWTSQGEFIVLNWTTGKGSHPEAAAQLVALGASDSYLDAETLRNLTVFSPPDGDGIRIYDNGNQIRVDPTEAGSYFDVFKGLDDLWHWSRAA